MIGFKKFACKTKFIFAFFTFTILSIDGPANAAEDLESAVTELAAEITDRSAAEGQEAIAVGAFVHRDNSCSDLTNFIYDELLYSLFDNAGESFRIVERAQLQQLLAEQSLSESVLFESGSAAQAGVLSGVGAIVLGTISNYGDTLRINARLVNSSSGRVFSVARSDFPLTESMRELTRNRSRATCGFSTGSDITTNNSGVSESMSFEVVSRIEFEGFTTELLSIGTSEDQTIRRLVVDVQNTSSENLSFTFFSPRLEWVYISDREGNFLELGNSNLDTFSIRGGSACQRDQARYCGSNTLTTIPAGSLSRFAIDISEI